MPPNESFNNIKSISVQPYRPKKVVSFVIKALQGTVATNNSKWRCDISQLSKNYCIGSIGNLQRNIKGKQNKTSNVTSEHTD